MDNYFWNHDQYEGAETGGGSASASRSHSEAEKRRRDRINARLATLRKLVPKSEKMDKAALLGHVVEHVNELSAQAKDYGNYSNIPSEIDEVTVEYLNEGSNDGTVYVKATICCNDRPQLYAELNSTFNELGLSIVQSDLNSLGGRVKNTFVLCDVGNSSRSSNSLKQSLKLALTRLVIPCATSAYSSRSKRHRFFCNDD